MKIIKLENGTGNNFRSTMQCEHCGHIGKDNSGYHDAHYHNRVIPAMRCKECGKNRAGETEHTDPKVSPCSV